MQLSLKLAVPLPTAQFSVMTHEIPPFTKVGSSQFAVPYHKGPDKCQSFPWVGWDCPVCFSIPQLWDPEQEALGVFVCVCSQPDGSDSAGTCQYYYLDNIWVICQLLLQYVINSSLLDGEFQQEDWLLLSCVTSGKFTHF